MENNNVQDINNKQIQPETINENSKKQTKKNKKKTTKIILDTLVTIFFLIILLNAIIGIINMQKINNDEEPIWYLEKEKTETDLKTVTEYHLGLYKIVKTDTARETKTTLKPFFLSN